MYFSIKSAYDLALQKEMIVEGLDASSKRPDRSRLMWNLISECHIRQKIIIFGCNLAGNDLPIHTNTFCHHVRFIDTWPTCGLEEEDALDASIAAL